MRKKMEISVLHLDQVKKFFSDNISQYWVLRDIQTSFSSNTLYAIEGVSGTGKSTLMHIMAGLDVPSEGRVFFNDQNIALMTPDQRSFFLQHTVGFLFQHSHLIQELTILENVMLPGLISGQSISQCIPEAQALLESVGILDKASLQPGMLSGGQQQRAALARALFNKPLFLLADEPTGNLDKKTTQKIVDLMLQLNQQWGVGIIVSTHDSYVAQAMEQRLRLEGGYLHSIS